MVPPIVGYPCPLRTRPVKHTVSGSCRPRERMEASLMPIARHSMWEEVGRMVRIPFSSTVLQRRRGYRRVLQHFSRIRLAPMIPLDKGAIRDLLELKDIVTLYELWTFFRIVHELAVLEGPPVRSWILYPGGEFRFFGVVGSGGQSGNQVVSAPEGLPDELQGVGAIPLAPVVGDKTDGGQREAATSVGSLRETLRRMLGGGSGMSTTLYIL